MKMFKRALVALSLASAAALTGAGAASAWDVSTMPSGFNDCVKVFSGFSDSGRAEWMVVCPNSPQVFGNSGPRGSFEITPYN